MDFLQRIFDQEINDGEEIVILGSPFLRADIVKEMEPETYNLAFKDWLDNRRVTSLENAAQITKHRKNGLRVEKLVKAFNAGVIVPFVGAGMSIPSEYPGWTRFLIRLCEESEIRKDQVELLLGNGHYEKAAQVIHDDLRPELFNELLENEFSAEKEIAGPIHYLPVLFPKQFVLTTNFDNLLERLYTKNNRQFEEIKSGRQLDESARHISDGSRYLVKLHGTCNQVLDRVLTLSEYEGAYSTTDSLYKFMKRAMISKSFLFLGCSLSSDRTLQTMARIVQEEGASEIPKHYALMKDIENDSERKSKQKALAQANIFPIWYTGEHEDAIEAIFVMLQQSTI